MSSTLNVVTRKRSSELDRLFDAQKKAYLSDPNPSYEVRMDRLNRLMAVLEDHEEAFVEASSRDFGHRSAVETSMLDVGLVIGDIKEVKRHLKRWMAPRRAGVRLHLRPATAKLLPQPLGIVGIIGAWNFPIFTTIGPAIGAIAAGNRVLIKPSEFAPGVSRVLADAVAAVFAEDELAIVQGDASVGQAFASTPFDRIIFTGSTAIGRKVAEAAAPNLTPVTLELGGKSPTILAPSGDPELIGEKIAYGKMLNAGQACIAPDYALVPRDKRDAVVAAIRSKVTTFFPTLAENDDLSSICTDRHYRRLRGLLDDAEAKGATLIEVNPANEELAAESRKFPLTIVLDVTDDMKIMQEEIFGPFIPIVTYDSLDEAIDYVMTRDRPLALYVFAGSTKERDQVLHNTISGGVSVNDILWHGANDAMPFGGVGASGMGAYHGQCGFDTCSHVKPVLYQSKLNGISLFYPPYGGVMDFLRKNLRKFM